jgi:hypothetical protein
MLTGRQCLLQLSLISALSFLGSTAVLPLLDVQKQLPVIQASCCRKMVLVAHCL